MSELPPYVWVLNPEAELEIAHAGGFTSSKRSREQMEERRDLYAPLVRGEPAYFVHELPRSVPHGACWALPWCPTPSCLRRSARAGYALPPAPPREVLARTLSRRFLVESDLPAPPGRVFVSSEAEVEAIRARLRAGEDLRVKRGYGFAGRGHRTLRAPRERDTPDAVTARDTLRTPGGHDDEKFWDALLRAGGALVEPELVIERELSMHGVVTRGAFLLGEPCELRVDAFGAPLSVARAATLEPTLAEELRAITERASAMLRDAGYHGPFGLDFVRARSEDGALYLYASDWNTRFTLGWSTGLGARRREALELLFRGP